MKILLIHRYYWPDTPAYASMLRRLAEFHASNNNDVTVLSSQPSYRPEIAIPQQPKTETIKGVTIHRLPLLTVTRRSQLLKACNFVLFAIQTFVFILISRSKFDIIQTATMPPMIGAFSVSTACRIVGKPFVYHMQDIAPEILSFSGKLSEVSFRFKILRWIDTYSCHRAYRIVTLSEEMKRTLVLRGVDPDKIRIINNFEPDDFSMSDASKSDFLEKKRSFQVLFAGNLGRFQGLENIVDAIRLMKNKGDIEFVFMGEGDRKVKLIEACDSLPQGLVRFVNHQPISTVKGALMNCDLGLVTIETGVSEVAYPSKALMYLANSCPMLVVSEPGSSLCRMVEKNNVGLVASSRNPKAIAKLFDDIANK